MRLLIRNVLIIDPENEIEVKKDILIENGIIRGISERINEKECETIEGEGKIIVPSLTDIHTHLREPGFEWKEDLLSGSMSAVAGGFTSIACMPNTLPPLDQRSSIEYIYKRSKEIGLVKIYPIGTITKGREGKELAEIGEMFYAGAKGFSDDGNPVLNSEILRCALEYSKMFSVPIIDHCEDTYLTQDGSMNWGKTATLLGLKGMPWVAEASMVARDIFLAQLTEGKLHIAHVSCWQSIEIIKWAKNNNINVTCEVTPHHLVLTEEHVKEKDYDTNTKVNPPLRTKEDQEALWKALKDDIIDVIASDHAPHHQDDKMKEYDLAEFGISGLETMIPLLITFGYYYRKIPLSKIFKKISYIPSKILNIPFIPIKENNLANFTLIDIYEERKVDSSKFYSKGKNTPFDGWKLKGWPILTIVDGKIVFQDGMVKNA
jgi:dihydroorotase